MNEKAPESLLHVLPCEELCEDLKPPLAIYNGWDFTWEKHLIYDADATGLVVLRG